ncbi:MAG: glycosyltransferase family 2 protein [Chthoniobacterales bacterium]|nr:glycosyltransferase family 2 protein [Chthoniobacterales bacterium]
MRISVIIPAYNAAKWLSDAVASVCSQSRPADEILIVDDGSTDGTAGLCATFPENVRSVRRENGGLSAARNTGVEHTSGEWMLFLDADDTLVPGALAALARLAETTSAGVIYGFVLQRRHEAVEARLHGLPYAVGDPPHPAKAHFWWTPIPTAGAALIRRSLNSKVGGFDENFRQVEDAEYWLRCGVTTAFAHCDALVLDKSCSPHSLGQNSEGSIWYRLQLQRKFLLWCGKMRIDTGFLATTPADMVDHALKRIHHEKAWGILEPMLAQAREMQVRTPWYWRAWLTAHILRLTGARRTANSPVVYSRWLETPKS